MGEVDARDRQDQLALRRRLARQREPHGVERPHPAQSGAEHPEQHGHGPQRCAGRDPLREARHVEADQRQDEGDQ
ncbi:hypothetical protein [Georgenia sp. SUBG003]|uniref:hypothetical protein n=1 Tax=Georgenia sp. SUBG003 TaxID=1497974 RepID=UPI003AB82821